MSGYDPENMFGPSSDMSLTEAELILSILRGTDLSQVAERHQRAMVTGTLYGVSPALNAYARTYGQPFGEQNVLWRNTATGDAVPDENGTVWRQNDMLLVLPERRHDVLQSQKVDAGTHIRLISGDYGMGAVMSQVVDPDRRRKSGSAVICAATVPSDEWLDYSKLAQDTPDGALPPSFVDQRTGRYGVGGEVVVNMTATDSEIRPFDDERTQSDVVNYYTVLQELVGHVLDTYGPTPDDMPAAA